MTTEAALLQWNLECHPLPCLAQCTIQSDLIRDSLRSHDSHYRLDELFALAAVRQVPS